MRDSLKTGLCLIGIFAVLLFYAHNIGLPQDEVLQQAEIRDRVILSPASRHETCEFRIEVSGKVFGYSGSRRNTGNPNAFKTCLTLKDGDQAIIMRMTATDLTGRNLPKKTTYYAYVHGVKIMIQ